MKISIIIPTLNEEKYLERLLKSIEKQDFEDYEIIVSDSKSNDNTTEIAENYGAKVITGERKGPGHARNLGAKKAKGEYLLFIDADVILPDKKTFSKIIKILCNKKFVGGTAKTKGYGEFKIYNFLMTFSYKFFEILTRIGIPSMSGFFIFTRKKLFKELNGFDEELPISEDFDFSKKLKEFGKLKVLDSKVLVSSRRLKERGVFKAIKDYFPAFIHSKEYLKKNVKFESVTTIENNKTDKN